MDVIWLNGREGRNVKFCRCMQVVFVAFWLSYFHFFIFLPPSIHSQKFLNIFLARGWIHFSTPLSRNNWINLLANFSTIEHTPVIPLIQCVTKYFVLTTLTNPNSQSSCLVHGIGHLSSNSTHCQNLSNILDVKPVFSSNLKEMTDSTYYPKSHILLGSIFFLDFRGSEPWQCSGLFLAPCKSFKVDVVIS